MRKFSVANIKSNGAFGLNCFAGDNNRSVDSFNTLGAAYNKKINTPAKGNK